MGLPVSLYVTFPVTRNWLTLVCGGGSASGGLFEQAVPPRSTASRSTASAAALASEMTLWATFVRSIMWNLRVCGDGPRCSPIAENLTTAGRQRTGPRGAVHARRHTLHTPVREQRHANVG